LQGTELTESLMVEDAERATLYFATIERFGEFLIY
jgi:hypothetical protein